MKISKKGLDHIKEFESFSPIVYICPAGKRTIGYGHVLRAGERFDEPISEEKGGQLLMEDVGWAEDAVNAAVKVPLTQGQFDALTSMVFNIGAGDAGRRSGLVRLANGEPSTLMKKLNRGDYEGAAKEILRWTRAGGVVLNGLVRRRAAENRMFLEGEPSEQV